MAETLRWFLPVPGIEGSVEDFRDASLLRAKRQFNPSPMNGQDSLLCEVSEAPRRLDGDRRERPVIEQFKR